MDFAPGEFELRTIRAQQGMREQDIDALFLMSEPEVRYFTGFRTPFWQSPTRPWFVVVPASGKPIAIVPDIGAELMQQTWIDDIRTWSSPARDDDGLSLLKTVLAPYATIGILMGRESHLRMPLADYHELTGSLRSAQWKDASPLIAALRLVKSEAEITLIGAICAIACDAFDEAPALFHAGQTMSQAFRAFRRELLGLGAEDVPYLVGGAGSLGYGGVISPPDETPLSTGDVLMLDTGATLNGYYCDFDRNFSLGQPHDSVKAAYETLWHATQAGLAAARPGIRCCDLFAVMQAILGEVEAGVGRLGHGLGMQLTEQPSLIGWDETVLPEGAVITLEPSIAVKDGGILVHEENIVIRDGAPQLLTRPAPASIVEI